MREYLQKWLKFRHCIFTIITVYVSTEETAADAKDEFYDRCQDVIKNREDRHVIMLVLNLNDQISCDRQGAKHKLVHHGSVKSTNEIV